ncbi:neuropilin-2-like [Amphiura filiformis]|uniref:neuropilin-2-like n=1 Tax=Amphiura filiformis TaxID=82378 RepID=UPI003B2192F1
MSILLFTFADIITTAVCMEPIGVENSDVIPDDHISYSSRKPTDADDVETSVGRFMGIPWIPATDSDSDEEYLEVKLSSPSDISTIITQGSGDSYVSQFYVTYLPEGAGELWQTVNEPDSENQKVFNPDPETAEAPYENVLNQQLVDVEAVLCAFILFNPLDLKRIKPFRNHYTCYEPLGMEDNTITDDQIKFSSSLAGEGTPGRLNGEAWVPEEDDPDKFMVIKLNAPSFFTGLVVQGADEDNYFSKLSRIEYTKIENPDDDDWAAITELGTENPQEYELPADFSGDESERVLIRGRYDQVLSLRIRPTKMVGTGGLRVEPLGCEHVKSPTTTAKVTTVAPTPTIRITNSESTTIVVVTNQREYK